MVKETAARSVVVLYWHHNIAAVSVAASVALQLQQYHSRSDTAAAAWQHSVGGSIIASVAVGTGTG